MVESVTTPLYALKDLEMKGKLSDYLERAKRDERSVRAVAADLSSKGAPVSKTTAYRWMSYPDAKMYPTKQRRR
jgi:hypothetical protein